MSKINSWAALPALPKQFPVDRVNRYVKTFIFDQTTDFYQKKILKKNLKNFL